MALSLDGVKYRSISDIAGNNQDTYLKPAKYRSNTQNFDSSFLSFNLPVHTDEIDPLHFSLKSKFLEPNLFFSKISYENFKFNKANTVLATKALRDRKS